MRTVAGVKYFRQLRVDEVIVGTLDRVLIAIPKRIQVFLTTTGTGFVLATDRSIEGSISRKVLILRKQLTVRAMESIFIRVVKQRKDGGSF